MREADIYSPLIALCSSSHHGDMQREQQGEQAGREGIKDEGAAPRHGASES